eukprot:5259393-Amphidinium_carterae.1
MGRSGGGDKDWRSYQEVVLTAVRLQYAMTALRADRDLVHAAVQQNAYALRYATRSSGLIAM